MSCPIALHAACSTAERITFRQINRATGNRLRQQLIDEETREPVALEHKGRGYEVTKGQYLIVEDAELEETTVWLGSRCTAASLSGVGGKAASGPRVRTTFAQEVLAWSPRTRQLLEKIVRPQHHWSFSLCWLFEELARCSLFNRIAQPHKPIYSLICLHITRAFKIVHRRGADRTPHCLALIKHREINDHPIEVVA